MRAAAVCLLLLLAGCSKGNATAEGAAADPARSMSWTQIEKSARGQTVYFSMWQGDPAINAYVHDFVVPRLAERYDIRLKVLPGQGNTLVATLMTELEARRADSSTDLVWINGETFYQLRQIKALYGPFTRSLPNDRLIDWNNPFIAYDFQQPVGGYECPWGNVQLLLITDSARVPSPPRTAAALAQWIHQHPGRFTFDTSFTGMSFLKSLMYAFADSQGQLQGAFNERVYVKLRDRVFDWIRGVKPDLWRQGETFPADAAQLHQLFANGEVDYTMSFNDGEVDNKVAAGMFPTTAQAFALDSGLLQNSHYLGIAARSSHKAAAMVAANFLISPEAQLQKLRPEVWGDGTVLDVPRLPAEWRQRFEAAAARTHAPPRSALTGLGLLEPDPAYMIHLSDDFRSEILRR